MGGVIHDSADLSLEIERRIRLMGACLNGWAWGGKMWRPPRLA